MKLNSNSMLLFLDVYPGSVRKPYVKTILVIFPLSKRDHMMKK